MLPGNPAEEVPERERESEGEREGEHQQSSQPLKAQWLARGVMAPHRLHAPGPLLALNPSELLSCRCCRAVRKEPLVSTWVFRMVTIPFALG